MNNLNSAPIDFFTYACTFQNVQTINVPLSKIITIDTDSNFAVQYITQFSDFGVTYNSTISSRIAAPVNVTIRDESTGRFIMDAPVPLQALAGTASFPFELPSPYLFLSGSTITVTITPYNLVTVPNTPYIVQIAFSGTKLFEV